MPSVSTYANLCPSAPSGKANVTLLDDAGLVITRKPQQEQG
jgi:hypothetical protein